MKIIQQPCPKSNGYELRFKIHGPTSAFVAKFQRHFPLQIKSDHEAIIAAFGWVEGGGSSGASSVPAYTVEKTGRDPAQFNIHSVEFDGFGNIETHVATAIISRGIFTFSCTDAQKLPEDDFVLWITREFDLSDAPAADTEPAVASEAETEPTQDHSSQVDESRPNLTAAEQGRLPIAHQAIKAKRNGMEFKDFCAQRGDDPTPSTLRRWIRDLKKKGVDGLDWN